MKLKKYLYTLVALCMMGAFTGCSDWLDYTPKDKETEDGFHRLLRLARLHAERQGDRRPDLQQQTRILYRRQRCV